MKRIVRIFLFVLSLGNLSQSAHAQQYPVQASVQLLPPYSVYLSDYANERLVVQLQLRDISKGEIPVRLRWQIRGGGVYLETNTTYLPTPNTVGVGMPLRLDGYDLAPYLRPENLLGNGGTAAWRRQAQLPEGMYTFCVQVLDDVTGAVVSNAACASAWLLRHEPPFLNLPEPEAKPEARDPQQLTFQWTPRHTGRPNANFQTEYDFRLVEIWPDDRDPNDAMQSSIPLYETTTASTMLVYGMAEPLLIPGRRYAWQVRARSLVNGESLAMFNNQGNSEVRSFRWGDACVAITEVRAEALSGGRIRLRWEAPGTHSSYRVQYRQRGTSRWYQQESFQPEAIITRLQPSTAYEYQVDGYCGSIAAGLSTLASVGTLEEVVLEYACGLPVPAPNQESASPLPQLRVGEVIQAADFSVTVTESSGQSGQFSGKGTVALPWLREAVAQVTFQEVQINEAYQLTAGELVVTGVALEVVPEELTDALAEVYDVVDQASEAVDHAEEKLEAVDEALATAQEVYQKAQEVIGEDRSSSEPESGTPGAEVPPANGGSVPAADGSGGNVNVADGSDGSPDSSADSPRPTAASEAQDSVDVRVQFRPNANQAYGFDRKEHDALAADYPPTLMGGETYSPAWKSVAAGRTDYVDAVAVPPDSSSVVVKFRTATGQSIAAQPGAKDSEQQLPVVGTTHETVDELTAYVVESDTAGDETETTVGQLNVISYDELRQKIIVVPVNDAIAPDAVRLSQDLNAIYGAAVAHWEVVIDDAFVAEAELLAGLDEGESGLLASFPRPMRQFNRAFKRSRDIDKDAYYVFLVPGGSASRAGQSRRGFMPFKQQFCYIFTEQVTMLSQIIAHELGHGAFRLRHTFDEFGLAKGTTDNLMDYSEGTALYKYQWDNVHDPEAMVGWLQGDDESAFRRQLSNDGIRNMLSMIRNANIKGASKLDIILFANSSGVSFELQLNNYNLTYLALEVKGNINLIGPQPGIFIRPSQSLISDYEKQGIDDKLLVYEFYPLNQEGSSYDPSAMMSSSSVIKIYVKEKESLDFESYLYNIIRPEPGDPLVEMSIVHNYSAPTSGGMFGCARVGVGCETSNIPNLPEYGTNQKVHAGIDVYAPLNTDIFAMYSGTVENMVETVAAGTLGTSGAFGNKIRVLSTPEEHGLSTNATIYIYYTHLNEVANGVKVGTKIKQGQKLGKTGNTGNAYNIPSWRYHTHINVYEGSTAGSSRVNPLEYFNTKFDTNGNVIQ